MTQLAGTGAIGGSENLVRLMPQLMSKQRRETVRGWGTHGQPPAFFPLLFLLIIQFYFFGVKIP